MKDRWLHAARGSLPTEHSQAREPEPCTPGATECVAISRTGISPCRCGCRQSRAQGGEGCSENPWLPRRALRKHQRVIDGRAKLWSVVTLFRLRSVAEHKPVDQVSCQLRCMRENRPVPFTFFWESSNSQANVSERICNLLRS